MRAYQGMTPEQINILIMPFKSKIFANHFISSRNMEEIKVFEEAIQRRMLGTIAEEEFFDILDKTSSEGGVGFDRRTAGKIVRRINRVIRIAYFVYQKGHQFQDSTGEHSKITFEEKAKKVQLYLYKTCYNNYYDHLNDKQNERIKRAVKDRLMSTMDKNSFYAYLDKSFKDGGVGLNSKTAKSISEELELILILGFGVVGVSEKMASMGREERGAERAKQKGLEAPTSPLEKIAEEMKTKQDKEQGVKEKVNSSASNILNQMKDQLNQEVKMVNTINEDDKKKDRHIVEEDIIETENLELEINKNKVNGLPRKEGLDYNKK